MGLSARPTQGCAGHQFPFRGPTVSGRSVSGAGITFFRIYRHEIAKDKVEVHENRRGLVLLRRFMASDGSGWRSLHAADDPDPSPDVAPIHDRQMVILERSDWSAWLEQTGNEADLLRALPAGYLKVEQVR